MERHQIYPCLGRWFYYRCIDETLLFGYHFYAGFPRRFRMHGKGWQKEVQRKYLEREIIAGIAVITVI